MNAHPWPLADYLAGELGPEQHAAVDAHLVECDECWHEVQLARLGQLAARRSAETAPADTRQRIIDAVRAERDEDAVRAERDEDAVRAERDEGDPTGRDTLTVRAEAAASTVRTRRYLLVAVAASVIGAIVVFGAGLAAGRHTAHQHAVSAATSTTSTPAPAPMGTVAAALSYFRRAMLPGTGIATAPAPDLHALGLRVTGASSGMLAAQPVTAYVYCDSHGTRQVYVFLSSTTFRAVAPPGGAPTETRTVQGFTLFSAARHPMLIVGPDHTLVTAVGTRLT